MRMAHRDFEHVGGAVAAVGLGAIVAVDGKVLEVQTNPTDV